ncbi:MAG: hypothetical protein JO370_11300 [Paucibacter sp.]|nr:hypothetical protein [Roseateles sp.]
MTLSAAFAAALNGTMVMPLIVLALSRIPGIDEGTATAIAAAELAGIALYGLLAAHLVRRARPAVGMFGVAALVLGEAASQWAGTAAALSGARLLAGLGEGALFSLISAGVASESNAERIWGRINLVGGVAMGLLLYGLSCLPPAAERGTLFLWLTAMAIVLAPWALRIRPSSQAAERPRPSMLKRRHMGLIWLVVVLVYGMQAGQWAVSAYMGDMDQMPTARVGLYLALSSLLGFVGALVPALARDPRRRLRYVLQGFLVMAAAVMLFFNGRGDMPFLWGQVGVNVGFYMVTPFIVGMLTENDHDGSLVLRTLVIALIGAAIGTALAGEGFVATGPRQFGWICVSVLMMAMAATGLVFKRQPVPVPA